MISCSLNIGIWGPRGNFTLDPDEDGIVAHMPISGQPFVKPTNSRYRKFINHGKWFVDILYGLDRSSTNVVEANLGDNFKVFLEREDLLVERRFVHKMYKYKWPYSLRVYEDGSAKISSINF